MQMPLWLEPTTTLSPTQCHNDIWLNNGDPNNPVAGDRRLITQSPNLANRILYFEGWNPAAGRWEVIAPPPNFEFTNTKMCPNRLQDIVILPLGVVANPNLSPIVSIAGVVHGFHFFSSDTVCVRLAGGRLWYMKHAEREGDAQYLRPDPNETQGRSVEWIEWGMEQEEVFAGFKI